MIYDSDMIPTSPKYMQVKMMISFDGQSFAIVPDGFYLTFIEKSVYLALDYI